MRNPESVIFTPKYKQARKELESFIPPDLAVKFSNIDFAKINTDALQLLEELSLRLGKGDKEADLLFAKIVAYNKKMHSGEELNKEEQDFLEELEKETLNKRREITEVIENCFVVPRKTLSTYIAKRAWGWTGAASIVKGLIEAGEKDILPQAKEIFNECVAREKKEDTYPITFLAKLLLEAGEKDILPKIKKLFNAYIAKEEWDNAVPFAEILLEAGERDVQLSKFIVLTLRNCTRFY